MNRPGHTLVQFAGDCFWHRKHRRREKSGERKAMATVNAVAQSLRVGRGRQWAGRRLEGGLRGDPVGDGGRGRVSADQ